MRQRPLRRARWLDLISLSLLVVITPSASLRAQTRATVDRASSNGDGPSTLDGATIRAVGAIGMTVSDLDRAVAFYTDVLTFQKVSEVEVWGSEYERLQGVFGVRMRRAVLRLGEQMLELTEYLAPAGRAIPADSRSHDLWFQHVAIVVSDMDAAYAQLRRHRVRHASTGPQTLPDWNPKAGGIRAFYFHDPDGHTLEILSFPTGKGAAKWHGKTDRLFLGIDHTAIAVDDTDASLGFYRDVLGMKVVGESENYGTEQEHLNNVFGARLRITTLSAGHGPSIELLEYLTPNDGRSFPPDAKANDVLHWQTRLIADNAGAAERVLFRHRITFISPGAVTLADGRLGFTSAFLVRDPDGHALEIVQR